MEEQVILVDDQDQQVGIMEKLEAHRKPTLHRAFSVFVFNSSGQMLLQKRAMSKYHSPGLWTNACCSHPRPGESPEAGANRRLREELGFSTDLRKIFHFIYSADFENGLHEYEYDHVYVGDYDGDINPDPGEVSETRFMWMNEVREALQRNPEEFTVWFKIAFEKIAAWKSGNTS